jgi:branched-subunit amino acid permease
MIGFRMNIFWENLIQLGIPLLIVLVPILVAVILVRKENKKKG